MLPTSGGLFLIICLHGTTCNCSPVTTDETCLLIAIMTGLKKELNWVQVEGFATSFGLTICNH